MQDLLKIISQYISIFSVHLYLISYVQNTNTDFLVANHKPAIQNLHLMTQNKTQINKYIKVKIDIFFFFQK